MHYTHTYRRAALCDVLRSCRVTITEVQHAYSLGRPFPVRSPLGAHYARRARARLAEARRLA